MLDFMPFKVQISRCWIAEVAVIRYCEGVCFLSNILIQCVPHKIEILFKKQVVFKSVSRIVQVLLAAVVFEDFVSRAGICQFFIHISVLNL